ncbi:MAG TPA: hypothetical protein VHL77_02010 [Ferruginibacter sp.]|jgi:hypothetical protein|nr:hypothetical protein [Ferruginibacter sp.]
MKLFKRTLEIIAEIKTTRSAYNSTEPFIQQPPMEFSGKEEPMCSERLKGNELFSHFTADIIKKNVRFTR